MKRYRVFGTGAKRRLHRIHPHTGRTMCNVENGVSETTLVTNYAERPEGRPPCKTCLLLCERTILVVKPK